MQPLWRSGHKNAENRQYYFLSLYPDYFSFSNGLLLSLTSQQLYISKAHRGQDRDYCINESRCCADIRNSLQLKRWESDTGKLNYWSDMSDGLVGLIGTKPGMYLEGGKLNIYSIYNHRCNYFPPPQAEMFYLQGCLSRSCWRLWPEKHPWKRLLWSLCKSGMWHTKGSNPFV